VKAPFRLIDTQALIWFVEDDRKLPAGIKAVMESGGSRLLVSVASLWEMAIKMSLNKLVLSGDFASTVARIQENGFELLPVEPEHLITLTTLDYIHRDPFDRVIIAQAITEGIPVVISDEVFARYPVQREWV